MRNILIGRLDSNSLELYSRLAYPAPIPYFEHPVLFLSAPGETVPDELVQTADQYSVTVRPQVFKDVYNSSTGLAVFSVGCDLVTENGQTINSSMFRQSLAITNMVDHIPYFDICPEATRSRNARRWRIRTADALHKYLFRFELSVVDVDNPDNAFLLKMYNPDAAKLFLSRVNGL